METPPKRKATLEEKGFETEMSQERQDVVRQRRESNGKVVGEAGRDLRSLFQELMENPARLQELAADGMMIADLLESAEAPIVKNEERSYFDSLTGLPNRDNFLETLHKEMSHAVRQERQGMPQQLHVLGIDLDGFKGVNDLGGHPAGDAYLQIVAKHMQDVFRDYDMVARVGGDEFVALVLDSSDAATLDVAKRVLEAVKKASAEAKRQIEQEKGETFPEDKMNVTASIGIAARKEGDAADAMDKLMKYADEALYEAKKAGKNQIIFPAFKEEGANE